MRYDVFALSFVRFLLILVTLILTGCETGFPPSTISGQSVENPAYGFGGFRMTLPAGYDHYVPSENPSSSREALASLVAIYANSLDAGPGFNNLETLAFASIDKGIAISVTHLAGEGAFQHVAEATIKNYIGINLGSLRDGVDEIVYDELVKVNGRWTGKIAGTDQIEDTDWIYALFFTHGTFSEFYSIVGICERSDFDALRADMEATMQSLDLNIK